MKEHSGLLAAGDVEGHEAPAGAREHRSARWQQVSEWPLTAVSVVFLAAYAWPVLDTGMSAGLRRACEVTALVTWVVFAVDLVVRLVLAERRRSFLRHHVLDVLVVVLPLLRPLRLLRLVTLITVLNRGAGRSLRGRVSVYVVTSTALVLFVASVAVLDVERPAPGAVITTFGDALWWALTTVTTVGYGDLYPVTTTGRFVAAGLMVAGIALLGVVTASLASWFLEEVREIEEGGQAATQADVRALAAEVARLRAELAEREGR